MKIFDTDYERRTLEPLVGARRQLAGVDLITFGDGHARNTRGARLPDRQRSALPGPARPRVRHRARRVRRHRAVLAAAERPRRAVVLRGRSRRLRLAARRPRRPVQHRRPGLDGDATDRGDGAVRVHPTAPSQVRHARPDRHHSRGALQLRGALGRRSARPLGRGHGAPGHRLRREPHLGAHATRSRRGRRPCRSATR